jgi:ATP dependent DNA ligase C terminal region
VRPEIVIEVKFTDWSGSGRLRHPVYLGSREDKAARDVVQTVADHCARSARPLPSHDPAPERQTAGRMAGGCKTGSDGFVRVRHRPGPCGGEKAALTEPWSNGQTEGQNTKLKLVNRQM